MRKLWNRPSLPVWSLVTKGQNGVVNMNICTYVTSVSMEPKLMLVALYHGTKTLENARASKAGVLQLLCEDLAPVVRVCGQMSGQDIDKLARLRKRYKINDDALLPYFKEAVGYMELAFTSFTETGGDHTLALASVVRAKNLSDEPILTTDYLKEHKFTR